MKLYISRYNLSDNSFELIHILPNTDSFSKIAGKSKLWARYILREGARTRILFFYALRAVSKRTISFYYSTGY